MNIRRFFLVSGLLLAAVVSLNAASFTLVGDISSICYYSNFFYNLPDRDFLHYFNDRLLFDEPLDERLYAPTSSRMSLLRIWRRHQEIRRFLEQNGRKMDNVVFGLDSPREFAQAVELSNLLGLRLEMRDEQITLTVDDRSNAVDYYQFLRLDPKTLEKQWRKTRIMRLEFHESSVPVPWDMAFLGRLLGRRVSEADLFETTLRDINQSLLLAVLYRLSDVEIAYLDSFAGASADFWKNLVRSRKMLIGMLRLSAALRVNGGRLQVPGGPDREGFWRALCGVSAQAAPLEFLQRLITADDGRLNYLYTLSFFLPEESRSVLLAGYDPQRFSAIYQRIVLGDREKLVNNRLPQWRSDGFFMLLQTLQVRDGKIFFPGGVEAWAAGLREAGGECPADADETTLLTAFLECDNQRRNGVLRNFMAIYGRFLYRPQLLTPQTMPLLFRHAAKSAVALDFLERIAVNKPATVEGMLAWVDRIQELDGRDRPLVNAMMQSLLDLIAIRSRNRGAAGDGDLLLQRLIGLPLERRSLFDGVLAFMENELHIDLDEEKGLTTYAAGGGANIVVSLAGARYDYLYRDQIMSWIESVQQSQETAPFILLTRIRRLLAQIVSTKAAEERANLVGILVEMLDQIPVAEISEDSPRPIRNLVQPYLRQDLQRLRENLVRLAADGGGEGWAEKALEIKERFLLPPLKDLLLSTLYAVHSRNPRLKLFQNPNLVRLHDFSDGNGANPWNQTGVGKLKLESGNTSVGGRNGIGISLGLRLVGGLSRLDEVMSYIWRDSLLANNMIANPEMIQGVLHSLLQMQPFLACPPQWLEQGQLYLMLVIDLAIEWIEAARHNPAERPALLEELGRVTSGFHYRKAVDYIEGRLGDYYLFFSELSALGQAYPRHPHVLDRFSQAEKLRGFIGTAAGDTLLLTLDEFGSVQYHSRGTLTPRRPPVLPEEVAAGFDSGWTLGERLAESKLKAAYLAQKNGIPTVLLGDVLLHYFLNSVVKYYAQNHAQDFVSTNFVFDIMSGAQIMKIVKTMQETGVLKLK